MNKQVLLLCALALFLAVGCGEDKGSAEAKRFETSKNLDSGSYQAVLNDPNANATDYAAAAMGEAGLDPVSLIQAMNEVSRCAQTPTPSDCTTTTTDDLGTVTNLPLDPAALDELQTAKDKLAAELAANPTDPDLNFQMTLTSLTSTLTALAQVGQTNSSDSLLTGFDPTDGISTTEADALGTFLSNPANQTVTVNADVNGDGAINSSDTLVTLIANDVANIVNTVPNANLGAGSDLNTVLTDATQGSGSIDYNNNGTITSTDITQYLNCVLGTGISGQG